MNQIVFLIIVALTLGFLYAMAMAFKEESRCFLRRLPDLIPSWQDGRADLKSFLFCVALMGFALILFAIAFH